MKGAIFSSRAVHSAPKNWGHVKQAPPDAILGVAAAFNAETRPDKVNLSIGAYRDETGKPVVLRCVRKAEALMMEKHPGHEYLPVCSPFPLLPFFFHHVSSL